MKSVTILITSLFVLFISSMSIADQIFWDDGVIHTIDDSAYSSDYVYLDYNTNNEPGTHAELVNNAWVMELNAYSNSTINMSGGYISRDIRTYGNSEASVNGGQISGYLWAYDNSTINMSGGTVGDSIYTRNDAVLNMTGGSGRTIRSHGNSTIHMSGGSSNYGLVARDNSTIYMSGGTLGAEIVTQKDGLIYLLGRDFSINGESLEYGDKLSEFGMIETGPFDYYYGVINGILADGSTLNNGFEIYFTGMYEGTGDIIIIPEPTTLLLLGMGGVLMRKRK